MGWDAAAIRNGELLAIASRDTPDFWSIEDLPLRDVFTAAASRVRDVVGCASAALAAAQLSGSHERIAFERAFDMQFSEIPGETLEWSAAELLRRHAHARWLVPDADGDRLAYFTVKEFVTACVENQLGVYFSW